jgi:membrane protease YdiL (CAAX protease family)
MGIAQSKRQLTIFYGIAFAWAWLFFVPLALSTAGIGWLPFPLSLPVMVVLGTLGPSIAGLLTLRITEHRWPRIARVQRPGRFVTGLLLAPLLIFATYAALPAIVLANAPTSSIHWSALASFSFYNLSTVIGGPLFEEPGWRGFALPRLQHLLGPFQGSLLLGILWASWHLPLFLCKSWSSSGIGAYLLIVCGLSMIFTFLYNISDRSMIVAVLMHASFNTSSRWLDALIGDLPIREWPSPVIILGLAGWVTAIALLVLTRARLGAKSSSDVVPDQTTACPASL